MFGFKARREEKKAIVNLLTYFAEKTYPEYREMVVQADKALTGHKLVKDKKVVIKFNKNSIDIWNYDGKDEKLFTGRDTMEGVPEVYGPVGEITKDLANLQNIVMAHGEAIEFLETYAVVLKEEAKKKKSDAKKAKTKAKGVKTKENKKKSGPKKK